MMKWNALDTLHKVSFSIYSKKSSRSVTTQTFERKKKFHPQKWWFYWSFAFRSISDASRLSPVLPAPLSSCIIAGGLPWTHVPPAGPNSVPLCPPAQHTTPAWWPCRWLPVPRSSPTPWCSSTRPGPCPHCPPLSTTGSLWTVGLLLVSLSLRCFGVSFSPLSLSIYLFVNQSSSCFLSRLILWMCNIK